MPVFTPNKTWSVDEMANATLLNQYQRDNMKATMHRLAYKTADETVTNSTTLQNDDHLSFVTYPNDMWYLKLVLIVRQPAPVSFNSEIKVAFTFTAGALSLSSWTLDTGGGIGFKEWNTSGSSTGMDADLAYPNVHVIEGFLQAATTITTFQLQWAQATADTGGVTVYKGSTLWGANIT